MRSPHDPEVGRSVSMVLFSKLRELEAKATPGPWEFKDTTKRQSSVFGDTWFQYEVNGPERFDDNGNDSNFYHRSEKYGDAAFIAEARNTIPKLLQVIDLMQEALDLYEEALKDIHEHFYGDGCDTADEALKRAKEIAGE